MARKTPSFRAVLKDVTCVDGKWFVETSHGTFQAVETPHISDLMERISRGSSRGQAYQCGLDKDNRVRFLRLAH